MYVLGKRNDLHALIAVKGLAQSPGGLVLATD
jgi:hypothetical protein